MKVAFPLMLAFVLALAVLSCRSEQPSGQDRATELAHRFLIVDTHIDVPYRLAGHEEDPGERTEGDFDYPRAREGGLDIAFMSIYVPASYQEEGGARQFADELIDMVEGIQARHSEKFAMVTSVAEARRSFADGKLGLALGMENGAPIEDDLSNLSHFHRRGIRYITLAHSKNNQICDSSFDEQRTWQGLSPFGREVVVEMNRLGIMIDISHVTDETFYQVMELSKAPVIASHSSCRSFTPGWERNMGDEMIELLGRKGGVIQINFGSGFLREDARAQSEAYWKARFEFIESQGLDHDHPSVQEFTERYWEDREAIYADLSDVVDHIDHVVALAGIDHVGLGSDFDGVGDSLPTGLKDVSQYPNLVRALLERGYTDEDVEKICSGNLLRVWSDVEATARRLQSESSSSSSSSSS